MPNPRHLKRSAKKLAIHLSVDAVTVGRLVTIKKPELKKRLIWLLDMMCDFSTSVNIRLCAEQEMKTANKHFRGKDYATDVLSFPCNPSQIQRFAENAEANTLGDILVCVPVCQKQAKKFRIPLAAELEKMMIHGFVHLKGFDHERGTEAWEIMTALEKVLAKSLVQKFGKPNWCQPGVTHG